MHDISSVGGLFQRRLSQNMDYKAWIDMKRISKLWILQDGEKQRKEATEKEKEKSSLPSFRLSLPFRIGSSSHAMISSSLKPR